MSTFGRVAGVYRNEGAVSLVKKILGHIKWQLEGGCSSRPRVRRVGGALRPLYNFYFWMKYGHGVDVMEEDWDTLILLDACRYDDFSACCSLAGALESRISKAADSDGFVRENFCGRDLSNCVYVTANPHVSIIGDDVFYAVVDDPLEEWDSEYCSVLPADVSQAALRAHDQFPNKRLIIHYMQPHDPPIGESAARLQAEVDNLRGFFNEGGGEDYTRLMDAVVAGAISEAEARTAYRENLQIVLTEVDRVSKEVDGRTVVSADHGEMFGERPYPILGKLYEHYRHPRTVELCKVPWFVCESGSTRRQITAEKPVRGERTGMECVEEQLEALGYK